MNTMLDSFRQISYKYGRALLGLLLFVWLSMAISPCVMANSVMANSVMTNSAMASDMGADNAAEMAILHVDMDNCNYCPDDFMNTELCQTIHNIVSDSVTFAIDSIDAEAFTLFEIPMTLSLVQLRTTNNLSRLQSISDHQTISPLALTGILRI